MTLFTNINNVFSKQNLFWINGQKEEQSNLISIYRYPINSSSNSGSIHIRFNQDGSGSLLINANQVFHLNQTAAFMAFLILEKKTDNEIQQLARLRFGDDRINVLDDLKIIRNQIAAISESDIFCPIHDLEMDSIAPFSMQPSAPYRMDLALTYRCNNNCTHCYNARPRDFTEMSTGDWFKVIDKTWEIGIPHIIFTGGEPTLRSDLPELIRYANNKGQITGINSNGRRMADPDYVELLAKAGLDHVQITFESVDKIIHNRMVNSGAYDQTLTGIKNCVSSSLYLMTNTTMLLDNVNTIPETIDFLAGIGVKTVGLNSLIHSGKGSTVGTGLHENTLVGLLDSAKQRTQENGQRLIWYTPTQYCGFDPQSLDFGVKGCTAALYNMCIEPNGDVLPCQSYYKSLGNILLDDWNMIWNHPLSINLRNRSDIPDKCGSCNLLAECGGGCPLQFDQKNIDY